MQHHMPTAAAKVCAIAALQARHVHSALGLSSNSLPLVPPTSALRQRASVWLTPLSPNAAALLLRRRALPACSPCARYVRKGAPCPYYDVPCEEYASAGQPCPPKDACADYIRTGQECPYGRPSCDQYMLVGERCPYEDSPSPSPEERCGLRLGCLLHARILRNAQLYVCCSLLACASL
jgi:hypothetical protein